MQHLRWILPILAIHLGSSAHAAISIDSGRNVASTSTASENVTDHFSLARAYERGVGVERNAEKAVKHYCLAARAGNDEAAFAMGWMFMTGNGIGVDRKQAAAWLKLAADQGHDTARRMLAKLPAPGKTKPACSGAEIAQAEHKPPANLVKLIRKLAPKYGLDPELVMAVVAIESGFKPDAVSPRDAQGLMQLTAETADRFGVADRFDPTANLHGGMRFLRQLLTAFDGDVELAMAAYNAGEGAVRRHGGVPPYAETQEYVVKVRRYYPRDRHPITPKDPSQRTLVAKSKSVTPTDRSQVAQVP